MNIRTGTERFSTRDRVSADRNVYEVTLSKRNLDTLLGLYAMYERGEALPVLHRNTAEGFLTVIIEPDEVHYNRPEGGPGSDFTIEAGLAQVSDS